MIFRPARFDISSANFDIPPVFFLPDELRLAVALVLAALAFFASWRFVSRRLETPPGDRLADVLLLFFLIQYASVTLPGLLHLLSPLSIAMTTVALSILLMFGAKPAARPPSAPSDSPAVALAAGLALGYVLAISSIMSVQPVLANDPLTYHFPAAVHWLQTGRLALFETWFFNPANTYSPLAGSTFIAWWMAPLGSDVLARTVQQPPVFLAFFALIRLARGLGVGAAVASVAALGLVVCRPFARQCFVEKDDLYVAAFFMAAAAGLTKDRLKDPLAPWRIGVAVGMLLATKYTTLLALPVLALAMDAPSRAGWRYRQWTIALGVTLLLAGPWYLRNALLTGNPLFPVDLPGLNGLFSTARSTAFSSLDSMWRVLTVLDQSPPAIVVMITGAGLVAALGMNFRNLAGNPLLRLTLLGPPLMLGLFLAFSPYSEARFLYPVLALGFVATALALKPLKPALATGIALAALFLPSLLTSFLLVSLAHLLPSALLMALPALAVVFALRRFPAYRARILAGTAALAVPALAGWIFVSWNAHLLDLYADVDLDGQPRSSLLDTQYRTPYGDDLADVWKFVRISLPHDQVLAYSNTYLVYPLTVPHHVRRIVYVPTRKDLRHIHDLPPIPDKLPGEKIVATVAVETVAQPDARQWLQRLNESGARHLVIFKNAVVKDPPELTFIAANPGRFERVFENRVAVIYRVLQNQDRGRP